MESKNYLGVIADFNQVLKIEPNNIYVYICGGVEIFNLPTYQPVKTDFKYLGGEGNDDPIIPPNWSGIVLLTPDKSYMNKISQFNYFWGNRTIKLWKLAASILVLGTIVISPKANAQNLLNPQQLAPLQNSVTPNSEDVGYILYTGF